MTTADELPQREEGVPVCDWCRMGLHAKCDRIFRLHAVCICDCERGF